MPYNEAKSIPSKSNRPNKKHKKINRKNHNHIRVHTSKYHNKKKNKLMYSPHIEHNHKMTDRLYYSD